MVRSQSQNQRSERSLRIRRRPPRWVHRTLTLTFLLDHNQEGLKRAERKADASFVVCSWLGWKEVLFVPYGHQQERYLLLVATDRDRDRHYAIVEYPDFREVTEIDIDFASFRALE